MRLTVVLLVRRIRSNLPLLDANYPLEKVAAVIGGWSLLEISAAVLHLQLRRLQ